MRQVQARRLDDLPFAADPLEEHDRLEREEANRVDAGPVPLGEQLPAPRRLISLLRRCPGYRVDFWTWAVMRYVSQDFAGCREEEQMSLALGRLTRRQMVTIT